MKTSKVICITGGIGSGKSTLCQLIESRGYSVYYSDQRAKLLMNSQHNLVQSITDLFGESAYESGTLNSSFIADCIFKQKHLKVELESLVHPLVKEDFLRWCNESGDEIVFKESALVLETKDKNCHFIVSVIADENTRIDRVKKRSPEISESRIKEIISTQYADQFREKHSHLIIENNGKVDDLEVKVDYLLSKVI